MVKSAKIVLALATVVACLINESALYVASNPDGDVGDAVMETDGTSVPVVDNVDASAQSQPAATPEAPPVAVVDKNLFDNLQRDYLVKNEESRVMGEKLSIVENQLDVCFKEKESSVSLLQEKLKSTQTDLARANVLIETLTKRAEAAEAATVEAAEAAAVAAEAQCGINECAYQASLTSGVYVEKLHSLYLSHAHPTILNIRNFQLDMISEAVTFISEGYTNSILPAYQQFVTKPVSKIYDEQVMPAYVEHIAPLYQEHAEPHINTVAQFYSDMLSEPVQQYILAPARMLMQRTAQGFNFALQFVLDRDLFPRMVAISKRIYAPASKYFDRATARLAQLPMVEGLCGAHAETAVKFTLYATLLFGGLLLHWMLELVVLMVVVVAVLPSVALLIVAFNLLFVTSLILLPSPRGRSKQHQRRKSKQ